MAAHEAACSCGQLRLTADSDPVRVSICHCLACQRRTGSVFGVQARFTPDQVQIEGRHTDYVRISDEGGATTFRFCPDCGATVYYTNDSDPNLVGVPVGAFADPTFQAPIRSIYEMRQHAWVTVPADIDHWD
jgi:hypothetical protein